MVASEEAIDKGRENDIVANGTEMGGSSKAAIENDGGLDGLEERTMGNGRFSLDIVVSFYVRGLIH
jgi:hypothetical protein